MATKIDVRRMRSWPAWAKKAAKCKHDLGTATAPTNMTCLKCGWHMGRLAFCIRKGYAEYCEGCGDLFFPAEGECNGCDKE